MTGRDQVVMMVIVIREESLKRDIRKSGRAEIARGLVRSPEILLRISLLRLRILDSINFPRNTIPLIYPAPQLPIIHR
jgi:hypothetical protein